MTEFMTDSQILEQRITDALATIRREWDHMLPVGPAPIRYGIGRQAQIMADDHADTGADIDAGTRLVSLRREVCDCLNGWSHVVMEDRPVTKALPDGLSVPSMADFLQRHAQWMSGHDAAPDMADEVEALAQKVIWHVAPPAKDWLVLGDCPFVVEDWFCHGQVRWYDDPDRLPACTDCGQAAVIQWWEEVLQVVPTVTWEGLHAFIRSEFGKDVPRSTLRTWKERKVIESCGVDAEGRTLYDKGAVAYAIARRLAA